MGKNKILLTISIFVLVEIHREVLGGTLQDMRASI